MDRLSYWEATAPSVAFAPLDANVDADVAIIGGGITGITLAMLLSRRGLRVAVVEAHGVALGTTAYSTGNLYATIDEGMHALARRWNADVARRVAESRRGSVDLIERTVREHALNCGFARRPQWLVAANDDELREIEQERTACADAGIGAEIVANATPMPGTRALRIDGQAQIHPASYVRGLARSIASATCLIFERSPAVEFDGEGVRTAGGHVTARHVVLATHTPKGFDVLQTELGPYREYAAAMTLTDDRYPEGIIWSMSSPRYSIRSTGEGRERRLIVVGELHKTGQPDAGVDYYRAIDDYARRNFAIDRIDFHWSAQHYRAADGLPYIGASAASSKIFVATGFGASGLVFGTLAATIIADAVLGTDNRYHDLYSARRLTPVKSGAAFLRENLNVAGQYLKDYAVRSGSTASDDLVAGEGRVVEIDGKRTAISHHLDGRRLAVSAICTHLGCIVHWNRAEQSWDCPCHGSRFAAHGAVLEGPALTPLHAMPPASA